MMDIVVNDSPTVCVHNATDALVQGLRLVSKRGKAIKIRDQETLEVEDALIQILSPQHRVILTPYRNNDIFATLAETLWVLAGRNDLAFLSHYLPRAHDFSDDGQTWRGGYGPRLRKWDGRVDQFQEIQKILTKDPQSRQAVMVIFDPAQDYAQSKDIPCNNWFNFLIREGRLNLKAVVRSNDVMWGFSGINLFEWSVLQECMAYWTNSTNGTYTHYASSFHVYSRHFERMQLILNHIPENNIYDFGFRSPPFSTTLNQFDDKLKKIFTLEERMRQQEPNLETEIETEPDEFLRTLCTMLLLYNKIKSREPLSAITKTYEELPECDLRLAAVEYLTRKRQTGSSHASLSNLPLNLREKDFFAQYDPNNYFLVK